MENVVPYYKPLIDGIKMGRHYYWSNFTWPDFHVPSPPNFSKLSDSKGKQVMMDYLDIHYPENIYYGTNHCPVQILRNCVHPLEGAHIFKAAFK